MEKKEVFVLVREFVEGMDKVEKDEFIKEMLVECGFKKVKEGDGRKIEVKKILEEVGSEGISIMDIGKRLNISAKNVSSILTYLRKTGMKIGTRCNGNKFIE